MNPEIKCELTITEEGMDILRRFAKMSCVEPDQYLETILNDMFCMLKNGSSDKLQFENPYFSLRVKNTSSGLTLPKDSASKRVYADNDSAFLDDKT